MTPNDGILTIVGFYQVGFFNYWRFWLENSAAAKKLDLFFNLIFAACGHDFKMEKIIVSSDLLKHRAAARQFVGDFAVVEAANNQEPTRGKNRLRGSASSMA